MRRAELIRILALLSLMLLSGLGELTAEAQLLRCRRQRACCPAPCQTCCPTPCKTCCAPYGDPTLCLIDVLYYSPGYWLYYGHYHYDESECPEYEPVMVESYTDHTANMPMTCDGCLPPDDVYRNSSFPGLETPVGASDDLGTLMPASNATKLDELQGKLTLPGGREISARVLLMKIKVKVKPVRGSQEVREVTEWFGFGFESTPVAQNDFHALEVQKHEPGTLKNENLYEFKIGTTKCVVLTVKK